MSEKLVIVPKTKTAGKKVLGIICFVLTCLSLVLAMGIWIFIVPAIVFGVLWYCQTFRNIEFEYTYYDGEFRFARIINKSRRKHLTCVEMGKVIAFAPKGDRSVYKYENDKNLPYKNLTSGNPEATVYELVFTGEKGMTRYEFEPDDEMLDAVMVKYPRSVIRASK